MLAVAAIALATPAFAQLPAAGVTSGTTIKADAAPAASTTTTVQTKAATDMKAPVASTTTVKTETAPSVAKPDVAADAKAPAASTPTVSTKLSENKTMTADSGVAKHHHKKIEAKGDAKADVSGSETAAPAK